MTDSAAATDANGGDGTASDDQQDQDLLAGGVVALEGDTFVYTTNDGLRTTVELPPQAAEHMRQMEPGPDQPESCQMRIGRLAYMFQLLIKTAANEDDLNAFDALCEAVEEALFSVRSRWEEIMRAYSAYDMLTAQGLQFTPVAVVGSRVAYMVSVARVGEAGDGTTKAEAPAPE